MLRVLIACILLCSALFPPAHAEVIEKIAAVVGAEVVTLSEVDEVVNSMHDSTLKSISDPTERLARLQELRRTTLDQMIDQRLLTQQYSKLQIVASEEDIDRVVDAVCKQNNITREALIQELKRQGLSFAEYRDQMRQHVLQSKFVEQQIRPRIRVSEDDVKALYTQRIGELSTTQIASLAGVMVGISRSGGPEAVTYAWQQASQAEVLLKEGLTPDDTARRFADGSVQSLGEMGSFGQGELMQALDQAVFGSDGTGVLTPVETAQGIYVLKVLSRDKKSSAASYEESRDRLFRWLYEQQVESQMQVFVRNARKETHVEILL